MNTQDRNPFSCLWHMQTCPLDPLSPAAPQDRNPFKFRHVQTLKNPQHFIADYSGPAVIMATPSGLQVGTGDANTCNSV